MLFASGFMSVNHFILQLNRELIMCAAAEGKMLDKIQWFALCLYAHMHGFTGE